MFTWPLFADTPLVPAFLLMLAVALLAAAIGLAAIIGAFVAGLIVAETEAVDELEHDFKPLASIFVPFFFAVTGAQMDLSLLLDPTIAVFAIVAGRDRRHHEGRGRAHRRPIDRAVGIGGRRFRHGAARRGRHRRGEPGTRRRASWMRRLFAALLVAVVLTTVVAPYLLAWAVPRAQRETEAALGATRAAG